MAPFIQGEVGLYRYDGEGIITPLLSGRAGVSFLSRKGLSFEVGVKVQGMAGFEWGGVPRSPELIGVYQIGVGFPVG